MENFNLFDLMGIEIPEEKKKAEKKAANNKTAAKKTTLKSAKTEAVIDVKNGVNVITGYYPPFKIERDSFDKDSITYAELVLAVSKLHMEFVSGECKVLQIADGYMVTLFYSGNQMSDVTKLSGTYTIKLADFSTEVSCDGEITKKMVEEAWKAQYPEFANVNFGYNEDASVIVPLLNRTASIKEMDAKNKKVILKLFGREEYIYEGEFKKNNLENFAKEKYPDIKENFYFSVTVLEDVVIVNVVPAIVSLAETTAKKEMYPTNVILSLAFTRFMLTPEMFGGKEEVDKETLLKKVQEDYGEYTENRTIVEYDKKEKMILLILKSSKKGGCVSVKIDSQQELLELNKTKESFICRYYEGETLYRIEKTPVGLFIVPETDGDMKGFKGFLPLIPFQILNEVYHFFKMVDACTSHHAEAMSQIYWDKEKKEYMIYYPKQVVRPATVEAVRNYDMDRKYVLVMDIHSHNVMPPFFSSTDDLDEKGTRLYCVFGHIDGHTYDFRLRAGTNGRFIDINETNVFQGISNGMPVMHNISDNMRLRIASKIYEKVQFVENTY